MVTELARTEQNGVARIDQVSAGLALTFSEMAYRVKELDRFYREVMQAGTDYDTIPGTPKPTLLQPGAQMLDAIFGLAPRFEELSGTIRDYERGFFAYEIRCRLVGKASGEVVAEGIGACNSKEDKYRWRQGRQTCPECGSETIGRSKQEYGGGFFCNAKRGGCGKSFKNGTDGARQIAGQDVGRVENDDPYTLANTILKMAVKRAHVAATLNATGASRIFTQDVEDLVVPESRPVVSEVIEAPFRRPVPEPMPQEQRRADRAVNGDPFDASSTSAADSPRTSPASRAANTPSAGAGSSSSSGTVTTAEAGEASDDPPPKRVFTIKDKQDYFAQLQSEARALGLNKGPMQITALLVRQADVMSAAEIESDGKKLREAIKAERERRKAEGDDPDAAF